MFCFGSFTGGVNAFDLGFCIWDLGLELCFCEFVVRALAFGIKLFQECQKTKQSGAVGGFGNELLHLSFLVDLFRSPRNPPIVFCFSFLFLNSKFASVWDSGI